MRSLNSIAFAILILASILVAGLIWAAGDILAMFFIAFLLAYLFDPFADWMVRHRIPRPIAALLITAGLLIFICGALAVLGPVAVDQSRGLLRSLQTFFTSAMAQLRTELAPYLPLLRPFGLEGLVRTAEPGPTGMAAPLATVVSGGLAFAGTMGLALLAPVVTFYLLKDWPRMLLRLLKEVPPAKRASVRHLARRIDQVLAAFLHGQAWVCLCVGVLYSIGFSIAGVAYAVVLGLIAGALKFLPYVGTAIAFGITMFTALSQETSNGWVVSGTLLTFLVVEFIESSILSPRIIGDRVRLAPAMVIFAVLIGGKLMGVIGVFVAIPVFAVGRELFGYWLHKEREGRSKRRSRARQHRAPASAHEKKIAVVVKR